MYVRPCDIFRADKGRVYRLKELGEVNSVRLKVRMNLADELTPDHALKEVMGIAADVGANLRVPACGTLEIVDCSLSVPLRHVCDEGQRVNGQFGRHLGVPESQEWLRQHRHDGRNARVLDLRLVRVDIEAAAAPLDGAYASHAFPLG
ncbi:hypothetical protein ACFY04_25905 [Streptomyces sp. NPDC001549]|uniref:hypothetical protein n=1 Tax=Streptomyces sp. NPDC001549 TaxID=3364586 RepID=UPI0036B633F8